MLQRIVAVTEKYADGRGHESYYASRVWEFADLSRLLPNHCDRTPGGIPVRIEGPTTIAFVPAIRLTLAVQLVVPMAVPAAPAAPVNVHEVRRGAG